MIFPKPFIKWVGGKQRLLPKLLERVPEKFQNYHEPFLGGASLFFGLSERGMIEKGSIKKAFLGDANLRLVRTYRALRDDVEGVISLLSSYPHSKEFYLELRAVAPETLGEVEAASWFIYLNRTGFNGLYRVNSKNGFNVAFGDYKNPTICDSNLLRVCSKALQKAEISHRSFEGVLENVREGDFVYLDPPYVPLSPTSNFTRYTAGGFGMPEQVLVRDTALAIKEKGASVLLSNSWTDIVLDLYKEFQLEELEVRRKVSAKKEGRKKVSEALIW